MMAIEKAELTKELWALAQAEDEAQRSGAADAGAVGDSASARTAVARVWPTVVETFDRLGVGVEQLRARLAQETAAREAAEAKLLRARAGR